MKSTFAAIVIKSSARSLNARRGYYNQDEHALHASLRKQSSARAGFRRPGIVRRLAMLD